MTFPNRQDNTLTFILIRRKITSEWVTIRELPKVVNIGWIQPKKVYEGDEYKVVMDYRLEVILETTRLS